MTSIRRWLLTCLILGFAFASLVAAYAIYRSSQGEAGELFDYELRTIALSLPANIESAPLADLAEQPTQGFAGIADDRIAIMIWDLHGRLLYRSGAEPALPRVASGFGSFEFRGHRWRAFGLQQATRFVQVAQPSSVRNHMAVHLASRALWPLAVMLPLAIVLVLFVVGRALSPLNGLSRSLAGRSIDWLAPFPPAQMPEEIRPLVEALNDLMRRLEEASRKQRSFVADAAHALRTPLAALKLQLQAVKADRTLSTEVQVVERLEERLNRIIHLTLQLLALAREDAKHGDAARPVSLRRVAEDAISELSMLAEAKGIDLGIEWSNRTEAASDVASGATDRDGDLFDDRRPGVTANLPLPQARSGGDPVAIAVQRGNPGDDYRIMGDEQALRILLNNLIENAIRHTAANGRVDVLLWREAQAIGLAVADTGTGIPDEELARVFDRFYRGASALGQGSGLGLAIATSIAARHHATLALRNRRREKGLLAVVHGFILVA